MARAPCALTMSVKTPQPTRARAAEPDRLHRWPQQPIRQRRRRPQTSRARRTSSAAMKSPQLRAARPNRRGAICTSSRCACARTRQSAAHRRPSGPSCRVAPQADGSLGAVAGAKVNQRRHRREHRGHAVLILGENRGLGTRRIVLGQLGDRREQPRAERIVEVLGRDRCRRRRQKTGEQLGANRRRIVFCELQQAG